MIPTLVPTPFHREGWVFGKLMLGWLRDPVLREIHMRRLTSGR